VLPEEYDTSLEEDRAPKRRRSVWRHLFPVRSHHAAWEEEEHHPYVQNREYNGRSRHKNKQVVQKEDQQSSVDRRSEPSFDEGHQGSSKRHRLDEVEEEEEEEEEEEGSVQVGSEGEYEWAENSPPPSPGTISLIWRDLETSVDYDDHNGDHNGGSPNADANVKRGPKSLETRVDYKAETTVDYNAETSSVDYNAETSVYNNAETSVYNNAESSVDYNADVYYDNSDPNGARNVVSNVDCRPRSIPGARVTPSKVSNDSSASPTSSLSSPSFASSFMEQAIPRYHDIGPLLEPPKSKHRKISLFPSVQASEDNNSSDESEESVAGSFRFNPFATQKKTVAPPPVSRPSSE
jgi:hypothetical protein